METSEEDLLSDLTPEQRAAVTHVDGPLIVVAGPGSGKTRVISRRVAWLRRERPDDGVLAITFTNKAAEEMRARIARLVGELRGRIYVSTFHSFCARMLRRYAPMDRTADFTIYDDDDQRSCVRRIIEEQRLDEKQWKPGAVLSRISDAKNRRVSAEEFDATATSFADRTIAKVYRRYEDFLKEYNALDFDDLLLKMLDVLEQREDVRTELRERFRYVLVDEYQDTNRPQYEIANQLAGHDGNLCVVGDPDQCLPGDARVLTPAGPRRIDEIREGDEVISATGWGKTAPMRVDKVMARPHRGTLLRIRLASGRTLRATPNHVCFGRLDPRPGLHYVYLMWRRGKGYRIGTTSGVRASGDGALMNGVQVRTNQEVADAIWILKACSELGDARYHEQLLSVKYGLPTMVFHVRGRRMAVSQAHVDRLFAEVDTESAAERLLDDLGLDRRFPHHRPHAVTRGELSRRYVWFTVFGDPRPRSVRPWHEHR
ncbi:MAG TPA: UvrD-helicase domain-containing protein, partial [Planctomycetota bacterium]|nr:UvrD-helicase domain-containing protein [Planctomycetota bacterium]